MEDWDKEDKITVIVGFGFILIMLTIAVISGF